jgi:hypothetical protein
MKQIKTIKALAKELCSREKGKKQVDIAQMTEIVNHLSDITFENCFLADVNIHDGTIYAEECITGEYAIPLGKALTVNGAKRFLKRSKVK